MAAPPKDDTEVTKWLQENGADEFIDEFYKDGYYDLVDVSEQAIDKLVEQAGTARRLARALAKLNEPPAAPTQEAEPPPKPRRDSSVSKDETQVTKWLKKQKAAEFVDAFYDAGYDDLADVSADVVNELVKEQSPGIATRLIRSLARLPRTPKGDPIAAPELPPGTQFDLSTPELTSLDGSIKFELPYALSTEAASSAITSPHSLELEDWMIIARNAQLLYGYQMDSPTPRRARRPVLLWKVPATTDFVRAEHLQAQVTSELTYTEQTASYARNGFSSQSAKAGFPFGAASFERSWREREGSSSYHKLLHLTGIWRYPRARLYLERCTAVNPEFVAAVQTALASSDQFVALSRVFEEYGHAVANEVLLGGQLYFQHKREAHGSVVETAVENTIKAAVSAKVGTELGNVDASGGAAFQDGSAQKVTAHELAERVSFEGFGGDTTLVSNPSRWADTVKDPKLWAVIANDQVVPTTSLLDAKLRDQVEGIWKKAPRPELALDGRVVTIRSPSLQPPVRVLGREVGAENQATPHPVRLPDWVLSDPRGRGVAWRFSFSGQYGKAGYSGSPLFWIELVGQDVLLAATSTIQFAIVPDRPEHEFLVSRVRQILPTPTVSGAFAGFVSTDVKRLPHPTDDPVARRALWYVRPADPGQYFGSTFDNAYFLEQFESHQVLSSAADGSGGVPDSARLLAAFPGAWMTLAGAFGDQLAMVRTTLPEFSVLVGLDEKTDDRQKFASSCWTIEPLSDEQAAAPGAQVSAEALVRREFYRRVRAAVASEPQQGFEIEENGGQQEWLYGEYSSTSAAVSIMVQQMDYQEGFRIGWREHTFEFGPDDRYLIVGWGVISYFGDGTNGSWWKATEQILLTHHAAVHVKSRYDRGCHWGFRVFYVNARDYVF